jgi:hypothetical protein
MELELFLFEIPQGRMEGHWRQTLEKRADKSPVEYDIRGQRLRVWNPSRPAVRTSRQDISYRDGIQLQKVDLGGPRTRSTIGLSICRLYFKEDATMPVVESQAELFGVGAAPEIPRHIQFLPDAKELLESLNGSDPILTPLGEICYGDFSGSIGFRFGDKGYSRLNHLARESYSKSILGKVRNCPAVQAVDLDLALILSCSHDQNKARTVARAISDVLQNEWGCRVSKAVIEDQKQLEKWKAGSDGKPRVVLIALDGKRGERPTQATMDWLIRLSADGIAFQLFSTQTNPLYSKHGTACATLAKAGGLLYRVDSALVPDLEHHWCIGLDLGLGGEYEGKIAVIALTDGKGRLCAYWRAKKDNDETLSEEVLRDGLAWIVSNAECLVPGRKFLTIRDGIRPKHEKLEVYADLLPHGRSTLVELSKNGNPLFVKSDETPNPGSFGVAPESDRCFLYSAICKRSTEHRFPTNS